MRLGDEHQKAGQWDGAAIAGPSRHCRIGRSDEAMAPGGPLFSPALCRPAPLPCLWLQVAQQAGIITAQQAENLALGADLQHSRAQERQLAEEKAALEGGDVACLGKGAGWAEGSSRV